MLSVSYKYDSRNGRTQEINKLIKLHILGVWQNGHEFIAAGHLSMSFWAFLLLPFLEMSIPTAAKHLNQWSLSKCLVL